VLSVCVRACVRACGRTVAARGLSREAADLAGNPAPAEERELSPHELLQRTLRSAAADAAQARRDSPSAAADAAQARIQEPSAAKARKDSPSDQLAKLAALNSEGIIDNDQYLKAKARVMAELQKQRAAEADAASDRQARGRGSAAPTPARAEDAREKQHEEDLREAPDVTGEKSERQKEAHAADEREEQGEEDRKKARDGSGEKSERQKEEEERAQKQQREEDRKDAQDAGYSAEAQEIVGSDDMSEKQKEKNEPKHQAQSGAGAAAAAAAAAVAGTKDAAKEDTSKTKGAQKAPVHKLMGRGREVDPSEAGILDRYHEYVDEDQATALPGQQGGEKLDPQQKSFFGDVAHEAYKEDAVKQFPRDMLAAMDISVKPCDDFYEFACGTFLKEAVIPDYLTASTLTWDKAKQTVMEETNDLLMQDLGEAGTFYRSCVAEDDVEAAGGTPLTPWFQAIAGVGDMASLSSLLATAGTYNWCAFFCWHVGPNALDTSKNRMVLSHVALTMPDQKYYVDEGAEMDQHRAALRQAVEDLLLAAGAPSKEEAKRQAATALAVETAIAKSMLDAVGFKHVHPVKVSRDRLKEISPSINWDVFFEGMGMPTVGTGTEEDEIDTDNLFVHDFHYLEKLETNVWSKFSFEELRIYLILRMVNVYAPYLSAAFADAKMVLNDDLYGTTEKSPRDHKCYYMTVRQFKESVGKLFVDTYFPEAAEAAAQQMLADIRGAFEDHLETLKWMDSETRGAAVEKLEGMDYQVGYPEGWPHLAQYGTLTLIGGLYENIVTVSQAHSKEERDTLYKEPVKDKWSHAATTINAYYSRDKNALFIPAGILQPPFFSPEYPDCRNYGGIGSVLGHEMTHGFDDSGRKYDATGKRSNWWDPETEAIFDERAACLVKQFDEFSVSGYKKKVAQKSSVSQKSSIYWH